MEGHARRLEEALGTMRAGLAAAAKTAADQVRRDAAGSRGVLAKEVDNTLKRIDSGSRTLLDSLTRSLAEANGRIDDRLRTHHDDVRKKNDDSQKNIRDMFSGHRKTVWDTVERNIADGDKLRTDKQHEADQRNRGDIRACYRRGGAKMNSYGNTSRGVYIGGAAFDVAEGTANKMAEQQPDILSGIAEITAPLADNFHAQGTQALDGFDDNLPKILDSVKSAAGDTDTDLDQQARKARADLDGFGRQTRDEITALAADATAQVGAFKSQMDAQIDHALGQMLHEVNATPARIGGRVSPPVQEAIGLLRTAQRPNLDAAAQLTDVLCGFLADAVTQTGATLQQSGAKSTARFQQISSGARAAMRQQSGHTDKIWKQAGEGVSSTLQKMTDGVDTGLGNSVTTLGDALDDTEKNITQQLSPVISDLDGSFKDCLADAAAQIDQRIEDGFAKNTEALNDLDAKMQDAADDAEFEWDHPVLAALEFLAGIIAGIVEVLAVLLLLLVVTLIIATVLGVSMLVAGLVLVGVMAAFAIGYGFGARLAAGQGVGEAFLGSVTAFGRSVPGMLYDMTGIPKLRRAFSDEHMSPFKRGELIGEGGTEFVLAVFAVRGAAKGIATGFRRLRAPPIEAPTVIEPEPRIGFGRERVRATQPRPPEAAPSVQERIGFGREAIREAQPRPPEAVPGAQERIGFGREAAREAQPRPPDAMPGAQERIGFGREAVREAQPRPPDAVPGTQERIGFGREAVREVQPRPPDAVPGTQERIGFGREGVREAQPRPPPPAEVQGATGTTNMRAEMPRRVGVEIEPQGGARIQGPAEGPGPAGGTSSLEVKASAGSDRPPGASQSGSTSAPEVRQGRVSRTPAEEPVESETDTGERGKGGGQRKAKGKQAEEQGDEPERGARRKDGAKKKASKKASGKASKKASKKQASETEASEEEAPKERKPTKAEKRVQAKRDADTAAAQREFQGLEQQSKANPSVKELESGTEGGESAAERPETPRAVVRRKGGGVPEDLDVAQKAGSEFERPMVRDFAARQPKTAETFGSSLRNWGDLRARFPRIAELFGGGKRPDAVSVNTKGKSIRLFDPTSRPGADHMEKSVEYADRLVNDPEIQRQFGGWRVIVEERYWESGHTRRVFQVVRRIPALAGAEPPPGEIPGAPDTGALTGGPGEAPIAPTRGSSLEANAPDVKTPRMRASAAPEQPTTAPKSTGRPEVRPGRVSEAPAEEPSARSETDTTGKGEGGGRRRMKAERETQPREKPEADIQRRRGAKPTPGKPTGRRTEPDAERLPDKPAPKSAPGRARRSAEAPAEKAAGKPKAEAPPSRETGMPPTMRGRNITERGTMTEEEFKAGMATEPHPYLYEIVDLEGNHLKWGIAMDPYARYNSYVSEDGLVGTRMRVFEPQPRFQALGGETAGIEAELQQGRAGLNVRTQTRAEMRGGKDWAEITEPPRSPGRPRITIGRDPGPGAGDRGGF